MGKDPFAPAVSIVIPNFNGEDIISEGLAHAEAAARHYAGASEVVAVDDGSSDGSVEIIRRDHSAVKLVVHPENRGFAEAVHTGVAAASHDIVILLNSDVRVRIDFIPPLVRYFSDKATFSACPLVTDPDGGPLSYSWIRATFSRGMVKKQTDWDLAQARGIEERGGRLKSLYASGGSIAFDKRKFNVLGGFLPCYRPFGGEDMDLGTRAWRHGWKTYFVPASTVVHDHRKATINRFYSSARRKVVGRKNRYLYHWINLPTHVLLFSHLPRVLGEVVWGGVRLDFSYLLGFLSALGHLRSVTKQRRLFKSDPASRSLPEVVTEIQQP